MLHTRWMIPAAFVRQLRQLAVSVAALLLGIYLVYGYSWVLDDAFIYFRYADNAVLLNRGLTFNAGEYVEGFTSPAWMTILLLARFLGLNYWPVILAVGWGSLIATWVLALRSEAALGGKSLSHLPAIFLVTNYAVLSHFTSGMETALVQVMAAVFVLWVADPKRIGLGVVLSMAPLVRPELALPLTLGMGWSWWSLRKFPWSAAIVAIVANLSWVCFRIYYYADFFPNTYYLKSISAASQGLTYLKDTLGAYGLGVLIVALFGILLSVGLRGERVFLKPRLVIWAAVFLYSAYVVKIGGDFVHYRYLAFPVCAMVLSFGGILDFALSRWCPYPRLAGAAVGLAAMTFWALSYPSAWVARRAA